MGGGGSARRSAYERHGRQYHDARSVHDRAPDEVIYYDPHRLSPLPGKEPANGSRES
jgi:hypothetical protein